jgi:fructose-1,6-bisphosphatase/inositol monophosphatase family enzyme
MLLADIVRDAGRLAFSMWRTELKNWTKGASSPVSEADIAVNDLLETALRSATPDYGWLSEESVDDAERLDRRLVWIVDPIDGTRAYLAGREDWCVSVALVDDVPEAAGGQDRRRGAVLADDAGDVRAGDADLDVVGAVADVHGAARGQRNRRRRGAGAGKRGGDVRP